MWENMGLKVLGVLGVLGVLEILVLGVGFWVLGGFLISDFEYTGVRVKFIWIGKTPVDVKF